MADPEPGRPQPAGNWLRRFLSSVKNRKEKGDVIAASVEQGARGVAVGKNIVQIGTLVIPTAPLLALPALVIVIVAAVGLSLRGPVKMQGAFNVAVAGFGQERGPGQVAQSEAGQRISRWVFEALQAQKEGYAGPDLASSLEIWHDSLPFTEKGTRLGLVAGEDEAARLAERTGAQVVIYGNLDSQGGLTPRFYLSPQLYSQPGGQFGGFRLGDEPIPADMSAPDFVQQKVTARTNGLFWLIIGLRQEHFGFSENALAAFRQAAKTLKGREAGENLAYFFTGQAALFLFQQDPQAAAGYDPPLDIQAQAAFAEALRIEPGDVRARIGLGSVHFVRAQAVEPPQRRLETPDLEQAIREYEQAAALAPDSEEPLMEPIAALALGTGYYLRGTTAVETGDYPEAEAALDQAVKLIQPTLAPLEAAGVYRLLGQAYLALGSVYQWQAKLWAAQGERERSLNLYNSARAAFERCIEQGEMDRLDEILTEKVIHGYCEPKNAEVVEAIRALEGGN
jgi:tetratricopeptide (TPR) repeat protein